MFKLSSRSATVLVIFSVALVAFCLATVFAAMTGPISILPNESDNGGLLDNLSIKSDSDNNNYQTYSDDYSDSYSYDDSQSSDSQVETTTDKDTHTEDSKPTGDTDSKPSSDDGKSDVVTTTDPKDK